MQFEDAVACYENKKHHLKAETISKLTFDSQLLHKIVHKRAHM